MSEATIHELRETFLRDFWVRKDRLAIVASDHGLSFAQALSWLLPHAKD